MNPTIWAKTCAHYTPKESMEDTVNWKKELTYVQEAVTLINRTVATFTLANDSPGVSGVIQCPKCKEDLKYAKIFSNGHTHGTCTTKDCLSWME